MLKTKPNVNLEQFHRIVNKYATSSDKKPDFYICPFIGHIDNDPSFNIFLSGTAGKPLYKCHGCGRSGDVFEFVQDLEQISFPRAVDLVASLVGNVGSTPVKVPPNRPDPNFFSFSGVYQELIDYLGGLDPSPAGIDYISGNKNGQRDLDWNRCFSEFGFRSMLSTDRYRVQNHLKKLFSESDLIGAGFKGKDKDTQKPYFTLLGLIDRIIYPWTWTGKTVALQGRAISQANEKYGKYKNFGSLPSLFFLPKPKQLNPSLWITEGVFNAIDHYLTTGYWTWALSTAAINDSKLVKVAKRIADEDPAIVCFAYHHDQAGESLKIRLFEALTNAGYPAGRLRQTIHVENDLNDHYRVKRDRLRSQGKKEDDEKQRQKTEANEFLADHPGARSQVNQILEIFPGSSMTGVTKNTKFESKTKKGDIWKARELKN